jgi:hypothetical protein
MATSNTEGMRNGYAQIATVSTFDYRAIAKSVGVQEMNRRLIEVSTSRHFDLVHLGKCENVYPGTVSRMGGDRIIHFYGDYRISPPRHALALGAAVDTLYLQCDDENYFDKFRIAGAKDVRCCLSGVDTDVFRRVGVDKIYDVSFFGNRQTLLEGHRFRNNLLYELGLTGIDVHVFGNKWKDSHPFLTGPDLALALNQSKIVLAVGGVSHVNLCTSWPRMLTAMACGTFVLCRSFKGLDTVFKDGKELVKFYDIGDCIRAIEHYLAEDRKRERIARNGRIKVLSGHRWTDRAMQLLDW